jgi:hypothetical protein
MLLTRNPFRVAAYLAAGARGCATKRECLPGGVESAIHEPVEGCLSHDIAYRDGTQGRSTG